jgi:hypothetical protein
MVSVPLPLLSVYFCTIYANRECKLLYISPEYFFPLFTWGNFHIANVPSLNWFSSEESKDWLLGLVMTRENPYPRELPLVSHSCKGK